MLQIPVEILLGKHVGVDLVATLATQVAWAVAAVRGRPGRARARHPQGCGARWLSWRRSTCRLVGARIRGDLQYRTSFVMFMTSQFLVAFLDFLAIVIIFSHVPRLAGWSLGRGRCSSTARPT